MVALGQPKYITPQEYLEREENTETKSEYHNGIVIGMAGADPEHNAIVFNCAVELGPQLRGSNCRGFANDLRVRVPACNKYFYPDVTIGCGEPQYENIAGIRSLLNPTLIIEVLSASTERNDRGDKFLCYQTLSSLGMYVLVAQDRQLVETFTRQQDGSWRYEVFSGIASVVPLPVIDCHLRLEEIYADIPFPLRSTEEESAGSAVTPQQD